MAELHISKLIRGRPGLNAAGQDFTGSAGDNTQDGTAGNDRFFYDQGGNDTLNGLGGNDVFNMGAALTATDSINGGTGTDTVVLDGEYNNGAGLELGNATMTNIEEVRLTAGHEYAMTLAQVTLLGVPTFTFDASALGSNDVSVLKTGNSDGGNIIYKGGSGADQVSLGLGFSGQFTGGAGADTVVFEDGWTSQFTVDGGGGIDTVDISVFQSNGASPHIALGANAIKNVEYMFISTNRDVSLRMNDANVAAGKAFTVTTIVNDGAVGFHFDGSRETDGHFDVSGGGLDDVLEGGSQSDTFHLDVAMAAGGSDAVYSEGGDDTIFAGDTLENTDTLDGGAGNDTLFLTGDYTVSTDPLVPDVIHSIETIVLGAGFNYYLPFDGAAIDKNTTMTVDASALGASNSADIRVEHSKGHLDATGGAGDDILIGGDVSDHLVGGAGSDTLVGRLGGDMMEGGSGGDYYNLYQPDNSTGPNYDTFIGFNADEDFIVTRNPVDAIDATVAAGTLDTASFNNELRAAIGGGQLGIHHAVLFTPTAGDLAGRTFLIVDDNGIAGYQNNADFVIDITGAAHLNHLDPFDFGPLIG